MSQVTLESDLPMNPGASSGLIWISLFFFSLLMFWATSYNLDIASHATGEVVPAGEVKRIQHLEGGIIEKIYVSEGQQVIRDAPLIELMGTAPEANLKEVESRIASLRILILRLESQLGFRTDFEAPSELSVDFAEQIVEAKLLLESKVRSIENKVRTQQEIITQKEIEVRELEIRQNNLKERLKLLERQIEISKVLLKDGLTNEYEHIDLLKESNSIKGTLLEGKEAVPRLEAALREEQLTLGTVRTQAEEDARKELEQARKELSEMRQRHRKFLDSQARTIIRSPIDGIIKSLFFVTEGGVVPPGGAVLSIVPGKDDLIVKAKLPVGEVGFVQIDQIARISLASSGARGFQPIEGKVVYISPDSISEPESPPYFQVRVRPSQTYFQGGNQRYELKPGVQVGIAIHTGTQTVMEYLLAPLKNNMRNAFSER